MSRLHLPLLTPLGGYRLHAALGEGTMGVVYHAIREADGHSVAIKFLSADGTPESLERFEREAAVLAGFSHPNIVAFLDSGTMTVDGQKLHYLTMEYLPALLPLDVAWSKHRDVGWLLERVEELLSALEVMHGASIIHRDLKPANLGIPADGRLRVLDLGLARARSDVGLTQTGVVLGSVGYLSPEQLIDPRRIDGRADLYAVGITLLQLLGGAHPFDDLDLGGVLGAIISGDFPPPMRPLPAQLEPIVRKLVATQREDRYPTARMVLEAIRQVRGSALKLAAVPSSPADPRPVPTPTRGRLRMPFLPVPRPSPAGYPSSVR